jgi:hypothetical protein
MPIKHTCDLCCVEFYVLSSNACYHKIILIYIYILHLHIIISSYKYYSPSWVSNNNVDQWRLEAGIIWSTWVTIGPIRLQKHFFKLPGCAIVVSETVACRLLTGLDTLVPYFCLLQVLLDCLVCVCANKFVILSRCSASKLWTLTN